MEKLRNYLLPNRFLGYLSLTILLAIPWLDRSLATGIPLTFVWALLALSYNIVLGFAGIPSFGHAVPFGVAAFITAMLLKQGVPFLLSLIPAALISGAVYVGMGLPGYRVRGLYYGILTLAISEAIRATIEYSAQTTVAVTVGTIPEMASLEGLYLYLALFTIFLALSLVTGMIDIISTKRKRQKVLKTLIILLLFIFLGYSGYVIFSSSATFLHEVGSGLPYVRILRFVYPLNVYLVSLLSLYISYLLIKRIITSPLGSTFIAIRENPVRASVIGYNVFLHQLIAFFISGVFAGVAGSVYVACIPTIQPDVFAIDKTFIAMTGAILGGLGTFVGPAIGGILAGFLRDYLSTITPVLISLGFLSLQQLQLFPSFILGLLYIIVVLALPYGIYGTWLLKGWKLKRKIESIF